MTLGDGILWSTVLILLAAGIYLLSIKKKWKTFGKVLGVLILIGAAIGGGIWGWMKYQDRPVIVDELNSVRIGMSRLDLKLLKGEPDNDPEPRPQGDSGISTLTWLYDDDEYGSQLWVILAGSEEKGYSAFRICQKGGYYNLLGIRENQSEQAVIDKLGEPTSTSIEASGLKKFINYEPWNVSYQIKKGKVTFLCISMLGKMTFDNEYGEKEPAQ
jgi:hypothetical protein